MPLSSKAIEQFLNDLDQKGRFYLADRILSTLNRSQAESLLDKLERIIADSILEKDTSVLFDIRKIGNCHYAYIKRLGKEYPNLYLGVMRFQKGKTYKITHKLSATEYVVRGLGLEQEGVKTYLKIEFLSPEQVIRRYLFYDGSLDLPRVPQQIDMDQLSDNLSTGGQQVSFLTPEQVISTENNYKNTVTPRKDWSAIFLKKDWVLEEIQEQNSELSLEPKVTNFKKIDTKESSLTSLKSKELNSSRTTEKIFKGNFPQSAQKLSTETSVIEVRKNFSAQVEKYLQQWANFSQLIPTNSTCHLLEESRKIVFSDTSSKVTVEYDRTARRLTVSDPRLLHSLILDIVSKVATNKLVSPQQQSSARQWLLHLQNPPLKENKELLAFIFHL